MIEADSHAETVRADTAAAARVLHHFGLVNAFGHVSARDRDGRIWITPTWPTLDRQHADDILDANVPHPARPLEFGMHVAIYAARRDVHAICRVHGNALSAIAAARRVPHVLHGFGGIAAPIRGWPDPDLIATPEQSVQVAEHLDVDGASMVLAGNGGLAVGAELGQAAARAWCLEDAARVELMASGKGVVFSDNELAARRQWFAVEAARLWRWMQAVTAPAVDL
jgi:HCOMODA/2-hydroxy-3-carboxy-muconic semialdehyde decarboxylase